MKRPTKRGRTALGEGGPVDSLQVLEPKSRRKILPRGGEAIGRRPEGNDEGGTRREGARRANRKKANSSVQSVFRAEARPNNVLGKVGKKAPPGTSPPTQELVLMPLKTMGNCKKKTCPYSCAVEGETKKTITSGGEARGLRSNDCSWGGVEEGFPGKTDSGKKNLMIVANSSSCFVPKEGGRLAGGGGGGDKSVLSDVVATSGGEGENERGGGRNV